MSQTPPPPPPPGDGQPPYGEPPAGGPGAPPPPPGGYGNPQASQPWDVGATVNYAWAKFQANAGQLIVAALAMVASIVVLALLMFIVLIPAMTSFSTPFIVTMLLNAIASGVIFVVAQILGAGLIRGALGITEGRPFQAAEVFKFQNIGPVLVTAVLVGAAVAVGYALCFLPGVAAAFVTSYSLFFVIDKGLAPVDAIKASFELVKANLANTIIWYLVGGLIASVGLMLCGVGALVAFPVVLIGSAYTYKKLTGAPIAP